MADTHRITLGMMPLLKPSIGKGVSTMEWGIVIAAISVSSTLSIMMASLNADHVDAPVVVLNTSNEETNRSERKAA